jgi:Asp/Glu/hydantoin racemase
MGSRILIINPNSNVKVTDAIDRSLEGLRFADGPDLRCVTLAEGPIAIETTRHAEMVTGPLCDLIAKEETSFDAFVIACFSDPGVAAAREITAKPVMGMCEAGVAAALNIGERYGILTNLEEDIEAELRLLRAQGLEARLAGIEAVGVPVNDIEDSPEVFGALLDASRRLRRRGARAMLLGCAGFTPFARRLRAETGFWIVDPVIAAVGIATAAVALSK